MTFIHPSSDLYSSRIRLQCDAGQLSRCSNQLNMKKAPSSAHAHRRYLQVTYDLLMSETQQQLKPLSCRWQGHVDVLQPSNLHYPPPRSHLSHTLSYSSSPTCSRSNFGLPLPHLSPTYNSRIALTRSSLRLNVNVPYTSKKETL